MAKGSFKNIAKNFKNNKWKRKISESLWIKDLRPTLNAQDKSVSLKLFNPLQQRNTCSDIDFMLYLLWR